MKTIILIFFWSLFFSSQLFSQDNFTCFVKDAETKEALAGVTAKIKGTATGTASDENGKVSFVSLPSANINISFTLIGYAEQTVSFQMARSVWSAACPAALGCPARTPRALQAPARRPKRRDAPHPRRFARSEPFCEAPAR